SGIPSIDGSSFAKKGGHGNGTGGGSPGSQPGQESKLCTTQNDTWVGSDTTTYGDQVIVWHDAISQPETVTVNYLNPTTVEFLPSMVFNSHRPEVHLSYKYAGITDNDANQMSIYFLDQATNEWILLNSSPT